MEVDEGSINAFHFAEKDIVKRKIGRRIIRVIEIPVAKEQYYEYMRSIWVEEKRKEREHRCILTLPDGSTIRCSGACKKCLIISHDRHLSDEKVEPTGKDFFDGNRMPTISLDKLYEDNEYEPCIVKDEEDSLLALIVFEDLLDKLKKYHPEYAQIFEMLYDGESQREIAKALGVSQSTLEYRIEKMRKYLQQFVKKEDLYR